MFDIGFWELSLILLLALLILGPERLPGMVSTVGNWAGRAKFMARSLRMQVERELAREVELKEGKSSEAKKPAAPKTPVEEAAEAAQVAEEEALAAARDKQREVAADVTARSDEQTGKE
ncbi:MAG: Sec-independent protein translocase protein TatB [Gammaproteobacteria bacterium]|jgi:sec-independent protein translocase protein TatB